MLIYCSECENGCSPEAETCPKCGHPLQAPLDLNALQASIETPPLTAQEVLAESIVQSQSTAPSGQPIIMRPAQRVQTIEKTGKKWKAGMALSACAFIVGMGSCMVGGWATGDSGDPGAGAMLFVSFGMLLATIGFVGFIIARIGAWWHHG